MPPALSAGMKTVLNQSLFTRLQALSLQPSELCVHVHTYGAEGRIYLSYRKILHATFQDKQGEAALQSMFALKDSWISESKELNHGEGNLNCFIEEFLIEALFENPTRKETRLIERKKLEKKFGRPIRWQGLVNQYEISLTVVGGSWDGHTFSVHPGDNLLGKVSECDVHLPTEAVSRRHCTILLTETQIRVIDLGSLNGTFLNGTLINDAILAPEDELCLGDVTLKIHYTLRRPSLGMKDAATHGGKTQNIYAQGKPSPRLSDCKTINWKEFVPKKQQILSKLINGLKIS
jgi:hypothetical protein